MCATRGDHACHAYALCAIMASHKMQAIPANRAAYRFPSSPSDAAVRRGRLGSGSCTSIGTGLKTRAMFEFLATPARTRWRTPELRERWLQPASRPTRWRCTSQLHGRACPRQRAGGEAYATPSGRAVRRRFARRPAVQGADRAVHRARESQRQNRAPNLDGAVRSDTRVPDRLSGVSAHRERSRTALEMEAADAGIDLPPDRASRPRRRKRGSIATKSWMPGEWSELHSLLASRRPMQPSACRSRWLATVRRRRSSTST